MTKIVTIEYDNTNVAARKLVEGMLASDLVHKIKKSTKQKNGLDTAIEDIKAGRVYKINNPANAVAEILSSNES